MRFTAALLALALPALANGQAQLLPAGDFAARDGRPGPGKTWKLSDAQGQALAAKLNAICARTPIAIDYEHQTLQAATNGQPAPAAGWIGTVAWRSGEGLFAQVRWTERALGLIKADEYRYISPVLLYVEQTLEIVGIHNAALVSTPAILGMEAVTAALAALAINDPTTALETRMDLALLAAMLGLAIGATEADVKTALAALMAKVAAPAVPTALATALGLQAGADEAAALAAVTRLGSATDAATTAAMQALQTRVATLSAELTEDKVTKAVDGAIAAHKLVPAQRDWAMKLGRSDMAQLSAYIASAPVIAGLNGQTTGGAEPGTASGTGLTATQALLAAQLGLDEAKFAAALKPAA